MKIFRIFLLSTTFLGNSAQLNLLQADPAYSSEYSVKGSTVKAAGVDTSDAYFTGAAGKNYQITIAQGSSLGSTGRDELNFDSGSVTNAGTLSTTNSFTTINVLGSGKVTNTGTITSTGGGDYGIQFGGSNGAVTNSGTINSDYLGVYGDTEINGTANANATFSVNNSASGVITATGDYGVYAEDIIDGETGSGVNRLTATLNNAGSLTGSSEGYVVYSYNENNHGLANIANFSAFNTGTIISTTDDALEIEYLGNYEDLHGTSLINASIVNGKSGTIIGEEYGIYVDELQNYYSAHSPVNTDNLMIQNSGLIQGGGSEGIYIGYLENEYNENSVASSNNLTIVNKTGATILGGDYAVYLDQMFNYDSAGTGENSVNINNAGSLTATDGAGVFLSEIYNDDMGSGASNNITLRNTGSITGEESYGIVIDDLYNEEIGGNARNIVTIANTGSIHSVDRGVYVAGGSYYVDGSSTNAYTFTNFGSIYAGTDPAVDLYAFNEYNTKKDTQTIQVMNSGSIFADNGPGLETFLQNDYDYNPGTESNSVSIVNIGNGGIGSGSGDAVEIANKNEPSNQSTARSIQNVDIFNKSEIGGFETGLSVSNYNSIQATKLSRNSIALENYGYILGDNDDAVDLENTDTNTTGKQKNVVTVYNSDGALIQGASLGLYVENTLSAAATSNDSIKVTNLGAISAPTYAVELDGDNASLITKGGTITGGVDAVYLNGTNSKVVVRGVAVVDGVIEGNGLAGNQLTFQLSGMTPAEVAAAKAAIVAAGSGAGSFVVGNDTYNFDGFATGDVHLDAAPLQQSVDSGISNLARTLEHTSVSGLVPFQAFYAAAALDPEAALDQLSGRELLDAYRQVNLSTATAMTQLADSRAFSLRSGASGLDLSGLNINPSSMIASVGNDENFLNRLSASVSGGTTMSDSKDEKTMVAESPAPRWGGWVSGTVTFGDETGGNESRYNSTAASPTLGVDYRLTHDLVTGVLLNYTNTEVNFADSSGLHENTYLGAVYADWSHQGWYVNGLAGAGYNAYDQSRTTFSGSVAQGSAAGTEVLATLGGGYDFKFGGLTVSPEIGLQYTHLDNGTFDETNGGVLGLSVGNETIDSLRTRVGVNLLDTFKLGGVRITPQVNAFWYHECFEDTTGVTESFAPDFFLGSFQVRTDSEDRDFAVVGTGVNATPTSLDHGNISFFVNYEAQVGQSSFLANTVDGGVRVGF